VDGKEKAQVVKVLFALHPGFSTIDFAGPLEIFSRATHENKSRAFACATVGPNNADYFVTSGQGMRVKVNMDFEDAHDELEQADVLVVVGGSSEAVLKAAAAIPKNQDLKPDDEKSSAAEPVPLIKAWAALQQRDPSRERTLLSVCSGALFVAAAGVLQGLSATTHPSHYTTLELLCQQTAKQDTGVGTDVQEERYVVNNARFEINEDDVQDNPFVFTRRPPDARRASISARKGSDAFQAARRRESLIKRQNMPLGGLRVVTSGGSTAGIDASLYLVAALVSIESAQQVAAAMQYTWQKGVCIESIDV